MKETAMRPYRVNYRKPDQTTKSYYTMATNKYDALLDFRLRTQHGSDSVISVEARVGKKWEWEQV